MLTEEQIEKMSNAELNKAGKARGLKIKTMSPFQIREYLKTNPQEITVMAAKKTNVKVKTSKKAATSDGPSKMDLAMEIFKKNPKAERKDLIKAFMAKAGLTKAGASTYVTLVRQKSK